MIYGFYSGHYVRQSHRPTPTANSIPAISQPDDNLINPGSRPRVENAQFARDPPFRAMMLENGGLHPAECRVRPNGMLEIGD